MAALAEAMAERGYAATTVADVLRSARVSRETFYEHFDSKLDCFLQTFDAAADLLVVGMAERGALVREGPPFDRVDRAIRGYLALIGEHPNEARLFLVESWAAGPAVLERRAAVQATLADGLIAIVGLEADEDRFAARALVAAIGAMVSAALAANDTAGVHALADPAVALAARMLSLGADGDRRYARRPWTG